MLKVGSGNEQAAMWWVAYVIIVSAQSKELGFWIFQTWSGLRVQPRDLFGQGLGLGLALDNTSLKVPHFEVRVY